MTECINLNKASGNNFSIVFPVLPFEDSFFKSKELILNIYDTVLPGMNFTPSEMEWQGWNHKRIEGNLNFNDLTTTMVIDEEFRNWTILYNWLTYINNNKSINGLNFKDYSTDASIIIKNNFNKTIFSLDLMYCFPFDLGDINLNYRDGEANLECQVSFSYTYNEIKK